MFDAALCPRMVDEGEAEDTYVAADFEKILEHFDAFFAEAVQEYCHAFFRLGTPSAYNAFRTLSERMLLINPKDPVFLTNMGTYDFIVAKDYSKALKYYRKALKINPDDYTALKNSVLLARQQRNLKLERKFLSDFVRVAGEEEKTAAETRLKFLSEN